MTKLIQKSGYIKPGRAAGYVGYIATRDGVELLPGPEGYLEYMAMRPGAERRGGHGLFSSQPVDLNAVLKEVEQHGGPVWTLIYSLRREDATRLGYDNAASWQKLIKAHQVEMATAIKISPEQFRWCAAYHDEGEHPHIHMTVWSGDPKQGYLTKDGINAMRSALTNSIFQDELYSLYQQKDISYKELTAQARMSMRELVRQMENSICDSPAIEMQMLQLSHELKNVSGKKVYGYLKKPLKEQVDTIVDELAKIPAVAECYEVWNNLRDELESYYKDTPRQHLPLSQQKEFKAIKNMVIQEAENLRLGVVTFEDERVQDEPLDKLYLLGQGVEQDKEVATQWFTLAASQGHEYAQFFLERMEQQRDPSALLCATRLLCAMAQIIRDTPPPAPPAGLRIDRKRFQQLMEKKIALGHKPDDHEEQSWGSMTM